MPEDKITNSATEDIAQTGEISSDRQTKDTLRLRLKGSWKIGARFPSADVVQKQIASSGGIRRIGFDTEKLTGWDSGHFWQNQRTPYIKWIWRPVTPKPSQVKGLCKSLSADLVLEQYLHWVTVVSLLPAWK